MSSVENSSINAFNSIGSMPVIASSANIEKRYPTSEAQLEIWLSCMQSVDANCAYNQIISLVFQGELDMRAIEMALVQVVKRNGSLRSTFSTDGLEVKVDNSVRFDFEFNEWSELSDLELSTRRLEVIQKQACTPFDLVEGPLLRVVLQKIPNDRWRLTVATHHIALDGWSLAIFCRDLGHFYDASRNGIPSELPPSGQYDDYSEKMVEYFNSDQGQADEAYWVDQFKTHIPVLDLPIEGSRPALRTYRADRYDHLLSAELVERIRCVGATSGCSLFNTLLAAFQAYLARLSGMDDICVGIPTAGQAIMDQAELMGHCVNTLPIRVQVDTAQPFAQFLKVARGKLLDALDHQRYSFGTLLRKLAPPRDPSRPPMLSVSFNVDPAIATDEMGFGGLDVDVHIEPRMFENFDWFINGAINSDKSIELQAQYNTDLYSHQSMAFYLEGFEAFITALAASPETPTLELPLMTVAQRERVICEWNQTSLAYPGDSTLHGEISRQSQQSPGKVAVQFGDEKFTYLELDQQSNRIARYLKTNDIRSGDLVGICVERSHRMLVYLLGILKSGAGYVPLDPAYPGDRLRYMCDHSNMKLVVTEVDLLEWVNQFDKPAIALDGVSSEIDSLDSGPVESGAKPSDICYVIYTSGSTGKPKGVCVPHGSVVNFLYSMKKTPGFTADDSVLAVTTLSFDIAVLELFLPTISGGTVFIASSMAAADGQQLAEAMEKHDVTLLQATPATWRMLIQSGWTGKKGLKVLCGGEPMPPDLVRPLLDRCAELWNMYGPTETTVWSAAYQITDAEAPVLIGNAIGNTQIYLLDQNGSEVPPGAEGEIYIGGAGVAEGYLNGLEMTNERFVHNPYFNPFKNYANHRLYKTGDLAKFHFDGNIQFLRRNDKQVKVRGFRIELDEIERNLETHIAIAQSVVVVRDDVVGGARLVAYFVAQSGVMVSQNGLRDHLRESLPNYMLPQHFVELEQMPQTDNGKIDFNGLPLPSKNSDRRNNSSVASPHTESEKYLAQLWQEILELDEIGLNDNFFDLGGHSLLVMQVITRVNDKTGIQLGPQEFLIGTLEQLADKITEAECFAFSRKEKEAQVEAYFGNEIEEKPVAQKTEDVPRKIGKKLEGFWD